MTKLHEVLAVEQNKKTNAERAIQEGVVTFTKKPDLFLGMAKSYEHFDEEEAEQNTLPDEHKALDTTVHAKLDFVLDFVADWFDVVYQKEATNQIAKSDVILDDGTVLAKDVPATFLLGLESKLRGLREILTVAPNLAPSIEWELDETMGDHIYKAVEPKVTFRTEKALEWQEIAPATEHHPAQVKTWEKSKNIGKYIIQNWSGMASSAEKAEMLRRLQQLEEAVKKARQRANNTDVVQSKIGKKLTGFILNGI